MSEVSVMNDEFHEWLDKCPVQWFRIANGKHYNKDKSYYEGTSYMFLNLRGVDEVEEIRQQIMLKKFYIREEKTNE